MPVCVEEFSGLGRVNNVVPKLRRVHFWRACFL